MDPLAMLRFASLFNPQGVQSQDQNQPLPTAQATGVSVQATPPDSDYNDLNKAFPIQREMTDQYRQVLQQIPQRQNFQPGKLRSIAAALTGVSSLGPYVMGPGGVGAFHGNTGGAFQAAQSVKDQPYNQALGDWKTQEEALRQGAANEQAQNTNSRIAQYNAGMLGIRDRTNDINENYKQGSLAAREASLQQRYTKILADSNSLSTRTALDDEGNIVFFRKNGIPVPTGMTPVEFGAIDRRNEGAMARVLAQQKGATERNSMNVSGANSRNQAILDSKTERELTPAQRVDAYKAAVLKDLVNNPAALHYITIDPKDKKTPVLVDRGWLATTLGFSDDDYNAAKAALEAHKDILSGGNVTSVTTTTKTPSHLGVQPAATGQQIKKAADVPIVQRVVGQPYLMKDGTQKIWTGNTQAPWR